MSYESFDEKSRTYLLKTGGTMVWNGKLYNVRARYDDGEEWSEFLKAILHASSYGVVTMSLKLDGLMKLMQTDLNIQSLVAEHQQGMMEKLSKWMIPKYHELLEQPRWKEYSQMISATSLLHEALGIVENTRQQHILNNIVQEHFERYVVLIELNLQHYPKPFEALRNIETLTKHPAIEGGILIVGDATQKHSVAFFQCSDDRIYYCNTWGESCNTLTSIFDEIDMPLLRVLLLSSVQGETVNSSK